MMLFAFCGKAQNAMEVKSIDEYHWDSSTDSFELRTKRFYDDKDQVVRTVRFSVRKGKSYVFSEESNYNGKRTWKQFALDSTLLSYKMEYDSLEYSIEVSYDSRGDSPTEEKRVYLRKDPKIESPYAPPEVEVESPHLTNILLAKYHYMLSESNKRWNDKGELVYSENWESTFHPNGAKYSLKRYRLNPKTKKKELREQVSFAPSGQLKEHLYFQNGELQNYKYYSKDGLLTKGFHSSRAYRNSGIKRTIEESFSKLNRKGNPVTVTNWRILEKRKPDGTLHRDTSFTINHYSYDRKGRLLKEELQIPNEVAKIVRTYQYHKNGDSSISSYDRHGQWVEKTHTYNAQKQLIREQYFLSNGFLKSSVNRKYRNRKVIKVWGLTQYQFGDEVQSEKYTYQKKGDTSFYWSFMKNVGSTEYVFNKRSVHFNPYDHEVDIGRYFCLFDMVFYNRSYSKTVYHYNQNNYCYKMLYYSDVDTNQMHFTSSYEWKFGEEKIKDPLLNIHRKDFKPMAYPPLYYFVGNHKERNMVYPTLSYIEKRNSSNATLIPSILSNYTTTDSSQEWKVRSRPFNSDTLTLSYHHIIKRIPIDADSLSNQKGFKEYYIKFNERSNSMDTIGFDILYLDASNREVLRQYFNNPRSSKHGFYQGKTVYQTFNATGNLTASRLYSGNRLIGSKKFKIHYLK